MGENSNQQLAKWSGSIRKLWQLPGIESGIRVFKNEQFAVFGKRRIEYPALIDLSENFKVKEIWFPDPETALNERAAKRQGKPAIWIDHCQDMKVFAAGIPAKSFCLMVGEIGSPKAHMQPILEELSLSPDFIREAILASDQLKR